MSAIAVDNIASKATPSLVGSPEANRVTVASADMETAVLLSVSSTVADGSISAKIASVSLVNLAMSLIVLES
jgi:hypothetical protein